MGENRADGDRQSALQLDSLRTAAFFGIYEILNEQSAPAIWKRTNELLQGAGFGARDLIVKSNVKVVCTTDDPVDSLEYHLLLKEDKDFPVSVLPGFRPDKGLEINREGFPDWVQALEDAAAISITTYDEFLKALENGCDSSTQPAAECLIMR